MGFGASKLIVTKNRIYSLKYEASFGGSEWQKKIRINNILKNQFQVEN